MTHLSDTPNGDTPGQITVEDELSLFDILTSIWGGRWLILGLTVVAGLLAAGYQYWSRPPVYIAQVELRQVTRGVQARYEVVNTVISQGPNELAGVAGVAKPEYFINSQLLMSDYFNILVSREALYAVVEDELASRGELPEEPQDAAAMINAVAREFGFNLSVIKREGISILLIQASARTHDPDRARRIMTRTLADVTAQAQTQLMDVIAARTDFIERIIGTKVVDLTEQIDYYTALAASREDTRLSYLRDQLTLARELGIRVPGDAPTDVPTEDGSYPLYLQGTEAIERAIAAQEAQPGQTALWLGSRLPELEARRQMLQSADIEDEIARAVALTPLADGSFKAVDYNIDQFQFRLDNSRYRSVGIVMLAVAFFAGLFVAVRAEYRKHLARRQRRAVEAG